MRVKGSKISVSLLLLIRIGISKNWIFQISRQERRKKLSSTYMFECNCDACKSDYPTLKKAADSTAKGLRRQLDKMLSSYQQSFSMGDLEQVRSQYYCTAN